MTEVTLPSSVAFIGEDAFADCADGLMLHVERDSYARDYARENDLDYVYEDSNDWLYE